MTAASKASRWRAALAASTALVLALTGWTVAQFETLVREGQPVLLELAPVDPRSLMQGDYMTLNYALETDVRLALRHRPDVGRASYAYLRLDADGRASWAGAGASAAAAPPGTVALRLRHGGTGTRLGPNAFFFQEGQGAHYQAAEWGELRVAPNGKALLVALRDAQLKPLGRNRF